MITAYHGSTHDIERFSLERVGSGEGVQAFGWGLYTASKPEVASSYRCAGESAVLVNQRSLADRKRFQALPPEDRCEVEEILRMHLAEGCDAEQLRRKIFGLAACAQGPWLQAFNLIRDAKSVSLRPGHLYKLEIAASEGALLDWDKPVHEQERSVLDRLVGSGRREVAEAVERNATGAQFYHTLARSYGERGNVGDNSPAAKEASQWLLGLGIPGIRYLDGLSRSRGEGSANFVIFDDRLVKIVEKDGVPVGLQVELEELLNPPAPRRAAATPTPCP